MDGILTKSAGVVDLARGPRPFVASDAMAREALETAHARAMAAQAHEVASMASPCPGFTIGGDAVPFSARFRRAPLPPRVAFDPTAAAREAERHHLEVERSRRFDADRIHGLWKAGRITKAQRRASDEIHDLIAWQKAGREALACASYSEWSDPTTGGMPRNALLEEAERLRFIPWNAWASGFQIKGDGKTIADLAIGASVQRYGVEQLAGAFHMHRRRAEALLVRALTKYAAIAGWERAA